jgi:hypothetical protein
MHIGIEELVLHRIIDLSILYTSDGFTRTIGCASQNILTSACQK